MDYETIYSFISCLSRMIFYKFSICFTRFSYESLSKSAEPAISHTGDERSGDKVHPFGNT